MRKEKTIWFIDMDGTIAEWKVGGKPELYSPGYFRNLEPTEFLAPIRKFALAGGTVYILSNYLENCSALQDKQDWLDEYFPEATAERRLFLPCGTNKAEFIKNRFGISRLTERMALFDDYSVNLHAWRAAGGRAVKCYNGINGSRGTWKGEGVMWSPDLARVLESAA